MILLVILGYFGIATVLGTAGLAVWKGGPAERWGVICYFAVWIVHMFVMPKNQFSLVYSYGYLFGDLLIATAFLILALRYSSLWLAGAMIAQGLATATHGFHLEDDQINQHFVWMGVNVWLVANNIFTSFVFWMLLGGTIATWRRRVRNRRAEKAAAEAAGEAGPLPVAA